MTLFNDTTDAPAIDPEKNYFEELVGEGKKYADQAAAGRALIEKDLFIQRLQRENAEVRQDLAGRQRLEELTERLSSLSATPVSTPETPDTPDTQERREIDLDAEIEKRLTERENRRTHQQNLAAVKAKLVEDYGSGFQAILDQKMRELGVGKEFLESVAGSNPKAFFALVGEPPQRQQENQPPRTAVNTSGFKPDLGKKTYSYYQNLRKTDPSSYHSPRVQNEMHKMALELGDAFFD